MLIAIERGDALLDDLDDESAISVISVSELLHGVHRAARPNRTLRSVVVEAILSHFDPIPITETVARVHALAWAELERRGQRTGERDLWIAATALTHDLAVATRNPRDFERIPGLRVLAA